MQVTRSKEAKESRCLENNLGLFSIEARGLHPTKIILVITILKNIVSTVHDYDNFRLKKKR